MEWTRSETLGLANVHCTTCHGLGLRTAKRGMDAPCNCVLRAIFRACFRKFRQCCEKEKHLSQCTLHFTGGRERSFSWGRKDEEYIADFMLMARRVLNNSEYRIFKFKYLLGADWKLCTMRLKMEKGDLFHELYKIESRLGKAFREEQPYGLFPLDEYFHGATGDVVATVPEKEGPRPLRPPMAA